MNKIYICGDIHGSYLPVWNFNKHLNLDSTDTIIFLGDFGGNYYFGKKDKLFKQKLMDIGAQYFVIRGNHEERPSLCMERHPAEWHIEDFWCGKVYVEDKFPNIKYALDEPSTYLIQCGNKFILTLVLPGAYSVDKYYRLEHGWSWFPMEQCNEKERKAGTTLARSWDKPWDLILSHTCPIIYEPTDLFLPFVDQSAVDKTTERWLGEIEYQVNYKLWCWGHYHANRVYPNVDGQDKLMLSNNCVLDLKKYFDDNKNLYDSLIKIGNDVDIDNFS